MKQQIDEILQRHAEQQTNLSSKVGRNQLAEELILEFSQFVSDFREQDETDFCVSCGIDTGVHREIHIDYRCYYVEGAGQMCKTCYDDIYYS